MVCEVMERKSEKDQRSPLSLFRSRSSKVDIALFPILNNAFQITNHYYSNVIIKVSKEEILHVRQ
jgi:hypothetical protein